MRGFSMRGAALAAAMAVTAVPATAAEYIANNFLDQNHPFSVFNYTEWAKDVAKASNGAITFKVFLGGSLIPARSTLPGIRDGLATVAYHAGTYTPSELPVTNVLADMSLYNSDIYVTLAASTEVSFKNAAIQAEYKKVGVVYGGGYSTSPYLLLCRTKISNLAELKGKRLRMPGSLWDRWAVALGAVSVNVPSSEIFTGLERGTLDCGVNPLESLKSRSWWDVSKYVLDLPLGVYFSGPMWGYNPGFWKGLKPEQRAMLLDNAARASARSSIAYLKNTVDTEKEMGGKGVQMVKPADDLVAASAKFIDADAKELGKMSQQKFKVDLAVAEGVISEYKAAVAKWEKLFAGVDPMDEQKRYEILKKELFDKVDVKTYGLN
ncbi:C4-dicarboxylate TRAP transporter substrate-binding protein [Stella sp.]|uniref:C4-dicarboxylate TRAP transporter substrate-binding protein n=1 Tax=Stella sp. TaxID=2912054 RepID=UPI0035B40B15